MSLLTWLARSLQYLNLRIHFALRNILVRLYVRRHRSKLDLSNVRHLSILGPAQNRISLYLHAPPASSDSKGPRPVHINIHGGGFTFDLHGIDARFCQLVAREAACWVVDADYRMAPQHPWPAAYDDVLHVLHWVRANEGGLFDTERVTVGGFSAGGNLSLALTGTVPDGWVKGVVAFYPAVDFTVPYAEKRAPPILKLKGREKGTVISIPDGTRFRNAYLFSLPRPGPYSTLSDPRLSPRFAPAEKFPDKGRTMILTCEYDYLAEEAEEFASELERKGREPVSVRVEGVGHGWDGMCRDGTWEAGVRDMWWGRAVEVIKRAQAGGGG